MCMVSIVVYPGSVWFTPVAGVSKWLPGPAAFWQQATCWQHAAALDGIWVVFREYLVVFCAVVESDYAVFGTIWQHARQQPSSICAIFGSILGQCSQQLSTI